VLNSEQDVNVIAAHEAGHVVVALHLGITPVGVRLAPRGASLAATDFGDSASLDAVPLEPRTVLAFSGLAGQIVAGAYWNQGHVLGDVAYLLKAGEPCIEPDQGSAIALLTEHRELFDHVRGVLEAGLDNGLEYVPLADLLPAPQLGP